MKLCLILLLLATAPGLCFCEEHAPDSGILKQFPLEVSVREVPKILHAMFLGGYDSYKSYCQDPDSHMSCSPHDSCKHILVQQGNWTLIFWDYHKVSTLIQRHYLYLWDVWRSYDQFVKRADMARALVLHRHGGLYLDLDVECFQDPYPSLKDALLILQGSGFEGVTNAIMASTARHPVWDTVFRVMLDRAAHFPTGDEWKDAPIYMTGPVAVKSALEDVLHVDHDQMVIYGYNGTKSDLNGLRIYALGSWYMPCWMQDIDCVTRFDISVGANLDQLLEGTNIVGNHRFTGSWG